MGSDIVKDVLEKSVKDSYRDAPKAHIPSIPSYIPPRPEPIPEQRPRLELPLYEPPPEYRRERDPESTIPDSGPLVIWESESMTIISYKGPRYGRNE